MLFQVKQVFEKKDVSAVVRALGQQKKTLRALRSISRICFMVVGLLLVWISVVGIWSGLSGFLHGEEISWAGLPLDLAFLALGVLLCVRRSNHYLTWLSWRRYKEKGMVLTYEFYEDCFTEQTSVSSSRYDYSVLENILEDQNHYFLFVNSNVAHVLRKDGFQEGDPKAFGSWLAGRLEKKIIMIH